MCIAAVAVATWFRPDPVSRRIAQRVAARDGRSIAFSEIAQFEWDKVYCFDCYTGRDAIEKTLGFPWPGLGGSSIEMSDGVTLIVFVWGGRVVRSFDQPRGQGDFGGIQNPHGLSKSEAVFEVAPGGDPGNPIMKLVKFAAAPSTTEAASQPTATESSDMAVPRVRHAPIPEPPEIEFRDIVEPRLLQLLR